jgi:hypothetical protein
VKFEKNNGKGHAHKPEKGLFLVKNQDNFSSLKVPRMRRFFILSSLRLEKRFDGL